MAQWKELADLMTDAGEQGWTFKPSKAGYMAQAPDGVNQVSIHKTPSDWHSKENSVKRMMRFGFRPRRRYW